MSASQKAIETNIESSGMKSGADGHREVFNRPEKMIHKDVPLNRQMKAQFKEKNTEQNIGRYEARDKKSEIVEKQVTKDFPVTPEKGTDNSKDFHFMDQKELSAEIKKRDSSFTESDISRINGFHDPNDGQAFVKDEGNTYKTAIHEKLHQKSNSELPTRLNEGITEHYAGEKAGAVGELKNIDNRGRELSKPESDYKHDVKIVNKIEASVGKDALNAAYFDGKSDVLKDSIDKKLGAGAYNEIVDALEKKDYTQASKIVDKQLKK